MAGQHKPFLDSFPIQPPGVAPSSSAWEQHEYLAPPVQAQAQKLLDEAGSPELAKQAIDAAAEQQNQQDDRREDLVRDWGFASWEEMLTLSTGIVSTSGEPWWITPRRDKGWMVWSQRGCQGPISFASFEEAHRHLLHRNDVT